NREALLRIPPLVAVGGGEPAAQMRLEYRGADASANPYLALGAVIRAGLDGIRRGLDPPPVLDRDPALLDAGEAGRFGVAARPGSLAAGLGPLRAEEEAAGWPGPLMLAAYRGIKRAEIEAAAAAGESLYQRYARIY